MCNDVQENGKPLPPTGYGYKMVVIRDGVFYPLIRNSANYKNNLFNSYEKWDYKWRGFDINGEHGFCFFPTLDDLAAFCYHCGWSPYRITYRIHYCGGLSTHYDLDAGATIGLCKSFKIADELPIENVYRMTGEREKEYKREQYEKFF